MQGFQLNCHEMFEKLMQLSAIEDPVPWSGVADGVGLRALRHGRVDQRATAGKLMSGSSLNWPTLSSVM